MEDVKLYEQCKLLSAILFNPQVLNDCCDIKSSYFSEKGYGVIFDFFKECFENGIEITPSKVISRLGNDYKDFVNSLIGITTIKSELKHIIKALKQDGQRHQAIEQMKSIIEKANDPVFDVFKAISEIEPYEEEEIKDFKQSTLKRLDERVKNKGKLGGVASGIKAFDDVINGFNKGCLYVCAGRSSMGKSAFMTSAISNIEECTGVGIISLEMTGEELYNRIVSIRTSIPYWVIDRGLTNDNQFERVADAIGKISRLKIYDKGGLNCYQVCSKIRQMVKEGCKIIFVDHLGLIKIEEKGNLAHSIGKITSALKTLAKELDIPIVLLSQVNRVAENQEDKRPSLKDLRDSGRSEEDADCVFFLFREEYYKPFTDEQGNLNRYEKSEILIEKNRNGACKNVKCYFDNQLMKFYE